MGFRHLFFIGLYVAVSIVFVTAPGSAQTFGGQASAKIQATATVVPSLGMTAPEDNEVSLSAGQAFGVRDIDKLASGHDALSIHRLLVRFPSLSSTLVTVESDTKSIDRFSLADWSEQSRERSSGEITGPGAMLVDLSRVRQSI